MNVNRSMRNPYDLKHHRPNQVTFGRGTGRKTERRGQPIKKGHCKIGAENNNNNNNNNILNKRIRRLQPIEVTLKVVFEFAMKTIIKFFKMQYCRTVENFFG